jgi:hypothetical protein
MIATNVCFVPKKQAVIVGLMTNNSKGKLCVEIRYFVQYVTTRGI